MFNWLLVCIENKVCIFVSWWLLLVVVLTLSYCNVYDLLHLTTVYYAILAGFIFCVVLFSCCLTSCLQSWCLFLSHFYLLWCIVCMFLFPLDHFFLLLVFLACPWQLWIKYGKLSSPGLPLNFCSCILLARTSLFPLACPKKKPDLEVHSVDALGFQPSFQQLLRPYSQLSCTTSSQSTVLRQLKNATV